MNSFTFSRFSHIRIASFRKVGTILLAFISITLLSHCGTTPVKNTTSNKAANAPIAQKTLSAEQYLARAQMQLDATQYHEAIDSLIAAGELFHEQQDKLKTIWLSQQLFSLVDDPSLRVKLYTQQLKALNALNQPTHCFNVLQQLANDSTISANQYTADLYQATAECYQLNQQPVVATDALIRANQLAASVVSAEAVWQSLAGLSPWQINALRKLSAPQLSGWLSLLSIVQETSATTTTIEQQLTQWQRKQPHHPAQPLLSGLRAQLIEQPNRIIHRIAVLLPLSGKQRIAGEAAQQGLLAYYQQDPSFELHFYDSQTVNFSSLADDFSANQIDAVIGPLLKKQVEQYLALALPLPTLLLNTPTETPAQPNYFVLSMQVEDEAKQVAFELAQKKPLKLLLISASGNTEKRFTDAFAAQWFIQTKQVPEILILNKDVSLQAQIQQALDVDDSRERVNKIKAIVKHKVEDETRNRRDIDMIFLVADAQETRLLKPYIDVNTSPFANIIPVYASSRSHDVLNDNKDVRDLAGLSFTDMPWLVPSPTRNHQLWQQVSTLWPERATTLQRIFAMGYDSIPLLANSLQLSQQPYKRFNGQTGTIQAKQQILVRSLAWAKYTQRQVKSTRIN